MMAADAPRCVVSIDLSWRWFPPCRRADRAGAFAPHGPRHPAVSSPVQTACPERAMPRAWRTLAGGRAARCAAPPVRRRPERQRRSKAQGKIKGRGTAWREKAVCTWGWRGTHQGVAACREGAQGRIGAREIPCFARRAALDLEGAAA
ncbi:hypothetical protein DWU98_03590 [Dyella monticola]|uniref:Uncharacterized protein n=1 Tax=Dyella monticola TaxID=1927958 RepID=A0A370X9T9_9GAMM|nr:hypothetical protein DWU98_03590 [Dyella monticola]